MTTNLHLRLIKMSMDLVPISSDRKKEKTDLPVSVYEHKLSFLLDFGTKSKEMKNKNFEQ